MNITGSESLSYTSIEYLRSLCDSMRNIQKSHGDNARIGFFSGRTVGVTREGSEAEREWVDFFHKSGVFYSADEGLEMNIVLVMSKIEEVEPFQGAGSSNSGSAVISSTRSISGASTSRGANPHQRLTEYGNILASPSEDTEVGRGVEGTPAFPDVESRASTYGYISPLNLLTPAPITRPVVHDVLELPEGLEQNLSRFIEFCDHYCHRHGLSWDTIRSGLRRLKLNYMVLKKLDGFLRKVNQHPEHSRQHFANNSRYGQRETGGSLQNSAQLFNKVSQLVQFMMKDADTETVSAMIYQAAARQEDDCHDQTLSIVDRLFSERHLYRLKKLIAEFSGSDIDWQVLLIEMKKRFYQDVFDKILGRIPYGVSGRSPQLSALGRAPQLIEHPEYIALHGMFKKLFSYNPDTGAGVCVFPDDSSSLLFDHWEGTLDDWKNIFHQFTEQFLESIRSEDHFINFLNDTFDDKGEGSLGASFAKIPEVSAKLSVVQQASHEFLEVFEEPESEAPPSLFQDLGEDRSHSLRLARRDILREKVKNYQHKIEHALPIRLISLNQLSIKQKPMQLVGGGRRYQENVVQVTHRSGSFWRSY